MELVFLERWADEPFLFEITIGEWDFTGLPNPRKENRLRPAVVCCFFLAIYVLRTLASRISRMPYAKPLAYA